MQTIEKSPIIIAGWRTAETAAIVSLLAFLGTLETALSSPHGIASYDWTTALQALGLGVASGGVNGCITALNLFLQSKKKP